MNLNEPKGLIMREPLTLEEYSNKIELDMTPADIAKAIDVCYPPVGVCGVSCIGKLTQYIGAYQPQIGSKVSFVTKFVVMDNETNKVIGRVLRVTFDNENEFMLMTEML